MPSKPIDITGAKFNRWTALAYLGSGYWLCRCDCGSEKRIWGGNLKNGASKSCGCLLVEFCVNKKTHGQTGSAEYKTWAGVKRRCLNPNEDSYPRYGGRGISVCNEWAESFEQFLRDMGPRPSSQHSIERLDNERNYEPGNCIWATPEVQVANKSNNRRITLNGITKTCAEWSRLTGIHRSVIEYRLDHGWKTEEALTIPPQ
jgi:hypothetical protein